MISIIQLELNLNKFENSYYRITLSPSFVAKDNFEALNSKFAIKYRSYKIERLLKKRNIKKNIKYLVK